MPKRNHGKPSPVYADKRYRESIKILRTKDHICHGCGYEIDPKLKWPHPLSWSADHIIPKSQLPDGDDRLWHISNLRAMHLRENQSRGNKPITRKQGLNTSRPW